MMPPFSTRSRCPVASQFYARTRCSTPTLDTPLLSYPLPAPYQSGGGDRKKARGDFFRTPFTVFQTGGGETRGPVFLSSLPCALRPRFSSKDCLSLSSTRVLYRPVLVATLRRSHLEILEVPISVSLFRRAGCLCSARCPSVSLLSVGGYILEYILSV